MENRRDCRNKSKYIKITTDVSGLFSSIQKRLIEEMLFKDTDNINSKTFNWGDVVQGYRLATSR